MKKKKVRVMMNMMTKIDKVQFKNYVENFFPMTATVDNVLRFWEKEKEDLYNLLGQELIIQKEINLDFPLEAISSQMAALVRDNQFLKHCYNTRDINLNIHLRNYFCKIEDFLTNKYTEKDFCLSNGVMLRQNTKLTKVLKKVCDCYNIQKELYQDFLDEYSKILNLKGVNKNCKLTLSIHPLDFLTLSDNDCNWHSCVSIKNQGCYARGTVDMMNSPYILIAYLDHPTPMQNPEGWHNKEWRELFIINSNFVTGIKGYPFQNTELEKITLDWIKELAKENWNIEFFDDGKKLQDAYKKEEDDDDEAHYIKFFTDTMYNDMDNHIRDHLCLITKNYNKEFVIFNYSGREVCLSCGEDSVYFQTDNTLICEHCYFKYNKPDVYLYYCEKCGTRIYANKVYEHDGLLLCEDCYEILREEKEEE